MGVDVITLHINRSHWPNSIQQMSELWNFPTLLIFMVILIRWWNIFGYRQALHRKSWTTINNAKGDESTVLCVIAFDDFYYLGEENDSRLSGKVWMVGQ